MVKNLIFDLGGVLIDFDPHKTFCRYFSEEDASLIEHTLYDSGIWNNLDLGTMSLSQVAEAGCKLLPERVHKTMTEVVVNWWSYMPPLEWMYEFVLSAKKAGFGVYLLSNTSDDIYKNFDNIPVLALLDGILASCDYGIIKPDHRIYEALYDKFSLCPAECFFIDDLPKNIEGAKQTGMNGFCFATKDLPALKAALRAEGAFIE